MVFTRHLLGIYSDYLPYGICSVFAGHLPRYRYYIGVFTFSLVKHCKVIDVTDKENPDSNPVP